MLALCSLLFALCTTLPGLVFGGLTKTDSLESLGSYRGSFDMSRSGSQLLTLSHIIDEKDPKLVRLFSNFLFQTGSDIDDVAFLHAPHWREAYERFRYGGLTRIFRSRKRVLTAEEFKNASPVLSKKGQLTLDGKVMDGHYWFVITPKREFKAVKASKDSDLLTITGGAPILLAGELEATAGLIHKIIFDDEVYDFIQDNVESLLEHLLMLDQMPSFIDFHRRSECGQRQAPNLDRTPSITRSKPISIPQQRFGRQSFDMISTI